MKLWHFLYGKTSTSRTDRSPRIHAHPAKARDESHVFLPAVKNINNMPFIQIFNILWEELPDICKPHCYMHNSSPSSSHIRYQATPEAGRE